jgi:hypothetical protein
LFFSCDLIRPAEAGEGKGLPFWRADMRVNALALGPAGTAGQVRFGKLARPLREFAGDASHHSAAQFRICTARMPDGVSP